MFRGGKKWPRVNESKVTTYSSGPSESTFENTVEHGGIKWNIMTLTLDIEMYKLSSLDIILVAIHGLKEREQQFSRWTVWNFTF